VKAIPGLGTALPQARVDHQIHKAIPANNFRSFQLKYKGKIFRTDLSKSCVKQLNANDIEDYGFQLFIC
jgi:hypothetical protein